MKTSLRLIGTMWMFISIYLFGTMKDFEFTGPEFNKLFVQFVSALLLTCTLLLLANQEEIIEKLKAIENANHNQDN